MKDTAPQQVLGTGQAADLFRQEFHELPGRIRPSVCHDSLEMVPDSLIRIQFRGVRREWHEVKSLRSAQEFAHRLAPMGIEIVQKNDQVAADLAQKMAEERRDFFPLDVVLIKMAVKRASVALMTDSNPGNGRYAVMTIPMMDERRLAHRAPCLSNRGDQQEARFVEENDMGCQPRGVFFTFGQTVSFHSAIADSLRSTTRRSGFWWLQPNWWRSFPT